MWCAVVGKEKGGPEVSREAGLDWMRDLSRRHNTVTAVTAFSGGVWLRLSASVYNCRQDFLSLRHVHLADWRVRIKAGWSVACNYFVKKVSVSVRFGS